MLSRNRIAPTTTNDSATRFLRLCLPCIVIFRPGFRVDVVGPKPIQADKQHHAAADRHPQVETLRDEQKIDQRKAVLPIVGADARNKPTARRTIKRLRRQSSYHHAKTSTTCAAIRAQALNLRDVCRAEAYARSPTSVGTCSKPISMHPTPTARVMSSAGCATSATVSRTRSPNSTAHRRRRGQARRDAGAGLSRHPTRHRMSDRRGRHAREGENPRRSGVSNRSSIPQIRILAAACLRSRLVASCNSLHVLPDFPVALESGRCRSSRAQTSPTPITTAAPASKVGSGPP